MKLLRNITNQDIDPNSETTDTSSFKRREATRAVVINKREEVYLLHISSQGCHKLPGGGVEEGESLRDALSRELLEELGCTVKVISEVGRIVEYRDYDKTRQTSFCYLTKQYGEQLSQSLDQGEVDEGHEIVLATNIDEAISILENDTPNNQIGWFINARDLCFLKAAESLMRS